MLFVSLDRVDLSLDRMEVGDTDRLLRPLGVVANVLSVMTLLLIEVGRMTVVVLRAAKVETESVSCC